jgi:predicted secreted protein
MDLATLSYQLSQPIASVNIHRKNVYLYALTVGDVSAIRQLNKEETSTENFKSIFRIFASHKKPNKANNKRVALPEDFINSLSKAEFNKIAQTYLETLYVKNINEKLKNPLHKNTDEEYFEYLYRLLIAYEINDRERNKEMVDKFFRPFDSIRETSSTLSNKLRSVEFYVPPVIEHTQIANKQRAEELEMARLTAEMTKESTNLLNELAKGVTDFLESWHAETENNNRTTNNQLRIAVISLAISVILSSVALYYSYKSYKQDIISDEANNKTQQEVIRLMSKSSESIDTLTQQNSNFEHHISELIENQKAEQQKLQDKSKETSKNSAQ